MASNAAYSKLLIENRRIFGRDEQTDPSVTKNMVHDYIYWLVSKAMKWL